MFTAFLHDPVELAFLAWSQLPMGEPIFHDGYCTFVWCLQLDNILWKHVHCLECTKNFFPRAERIWWYIRESYKHALCPQLTTCHSSVVCHATAQMSLESNINWQVSYCTSEKRRNRTGNMLAKRQDHTVSVRSVATTRLMIKATSPFLIRMLSVG